MMINQKGKVLPVIIIIVIAVIGLVGAAGAAALLGEAPKCPNEAGSARSEKEIGDILEKGSVTINDGEASALGGVYVGSAIKDLRVCFTRGLGHVSGKINLGSFTPSFYASAGVDLSGSTPETTNLNIKVGALPDVPVLSDQAGKAVSGIINRNLGKFTLQKKYSIDFSDGSVTINNLSK